MRQKSILVTWVIVLAVLITGAACDEGTDQSSVEPSISPTLTAMPTSIPTPTPSVQPTTTGMPTATPTTGGTTTEVPIPTRTPKNCPLDREDLKVALADYYEQNNEWPTIDGHPGDMYWGKLVPDYLDGVPSTDGKCDWQVNTDPPGELCLANYC